MNVRELLVKNVAPAMLEIMQKAGETGQRLGCRVYAAGGIVRDILLGAKNLDLDLVVEGDGIALARGLAGLYGARVRIHERFGTAQILFDRFKVDVATARVEFYAHPGALPRVENSTLRQDLYRRDFTINALAIALNGEQSGELIDYFGGRADLSAGLVRVLHNLSFIEDPTRILRAVRFEQRYGFQIEAHTKKLLAGAVRRRVFARVSNERIWEELKHILAEPKAGEMLARLHELRVWPDLFPGVAYPEVAPALKKLRGARELLRSWGFARPGEQGQNYILAVTYLLSGEEAKKLCAKYRFNKRQTEKVTKTVLHWREIIARLREAKGEEPGPAGAGASARLLAAVPREAYPLLLALLAGPAEQELFRRALVLVRDSRPRVDGKFIQSLGYRPGPVFREALNAVRQARLEGRLATKEAEMEFVREYLRQKTGLDE